MRRVENHALLGKTVEGGRFEPRVRVVGAEVER